MRDYLYHLATDKYRGLLAGVLKSLLWIFSLIYGLIVRILIFIRRLKPYKFNCQVISVGNITLGGTGKTSLVEFIAQYLKKQGRKIAIISRGYKRKLTACSAYQLTAYETMGDESYMLKTKLKDVPILVDANRRRAIKRAISDYAVDTVILDDAFQQWRIKKDLEIVTIDATEPFGNRYLIPRGILREPLSSLVRADIFVLTKTNLNPDIQDIKDYLNSINPLATIVESMHNPTGFYALSKSDELLNTDTLKGRTVTLFSGIGDPDSFENLIISMGVNVGLVFRFPDHHCYSQKDLDNIIRQSQSKNIDTVITTEKDAARLYGIRNAEYGIRILVLRIELKITKNEEGFYNRLQRLYSA